MTVAEPDYVAREGAALANERIRAHEDRCEERWGEARKAMGDMQTELRAFKHWIIGLVIVGMAAVLFELVKLVMRP